MYIINIIKHFTIASLVFFLIPLKNIEAKTINSKTINTSNSKTNIKDSNNLKNSDKTQKSNQILSPKSQNDLVKKFNNSFEIGIGKLNGKAQEIVFDGNKKLSQLDWALRDVKMLSFNFDRRLSDIFNIGLKYSNNIDHGSERGLMYDYDWLGKGYDGNINEHNWTHRSISKLKVQKIQQFKLTSSINIYNDIFFTNIGYNYDNFKWRDYAQSYIYSSYDENTDTSSNFRKNIGSFGGVRAISYKQSFYTPFIGFAVKKSFLEKRLAFDFYANYSPIARSISYDTHHLRDLNLKSKFDKMKYYNYGFNFGGKIYENLYAGIAYDFTYYPLKRGDTYVTKTSNIDSSLNELNINETYISPNSAGIRNKNQSISFNLKYNFTSNY